MPLEKLVKKMGNSLVISFDKEDRGLYGIQVGTKVIVEFPEEKKKENETRESQGNGL